jgi:hypothetical protein
MLLGNSTTGERIYATPQARAACPSCGGQLIAKCGEININHWAHVSGHDCDLWAENEGPWHLSWKEYAPKDCCEIIIVKDGKTHRADIMIDGLVIELQHSSISPALIREREQFYGDMVWLFDASKFERRFWIRDKGDYYTFKWSHLRKSLLSVTKPIFFDLGKVRSSRVRSTYLRSDARRIFQPKKLYANGRGWGQYWSMQQFISRCGLVSESPDWDEGEDEQQEGTGRDRFR